MSDGTSRPEYFYHRAWDRARGWWNSRSWRRRQGEFKRTGTRYYGDGGTIHNSSKLDVEVDVGGKVVAVWFRCQALPFRQSMAEEQRAREMRNMYTNHQCELHGVEVKDPPR
jgi:hypothetical protein